MCCGCAWWQPSRGGRPCNPGFGAQASQPTSLLGCPLCVRRWEGGSGVDFKVHGFSHKLPLLAAYVFRCLAGLRAEPDAFARVKESLLRNVSGWG